MAEPKHQILELEIALTFLVVLVLSGCAQSLPSSKYDGFLYRHHRVDSDSILIEAFFNPVCLDSRDASPQTSRRALRLSRDGGNSPFTVALP
ncbi:hypothetical protein ACFX12_029793 [Malus domestica]